MTLRIPIGAIDTVRVTGPSGQGAVIVLTSAAGKGAVYPLQVTSAQAVQAFAWAVNSAIPVRDAAQRHADGDAVVTVVEPAGRGSALRRGLDRHADTVAVATPCLLVLIAPLAMWDWQDALAFGVVCLLLLPGLPLGRFLLRVAEDRWLLRRRGITVLSNAGTLVTAEETEWRTYSFVDATGTTRPFDGHGKRLSKNPDRIEITYDPFDGDRVCSRHHWWYWALALPGYLIALPYALAAAIWPAFFFFSFVLSSH